MKHINYCSCLPLQRIPLGSMHVTNEFQYSRCASGYELTDKASLLLSA